MDHVYMELVQQTPINLLYNMSLWTKLNIKQHIYIGHGLLGCNEIENGWIGYN